jgi:hypothetical protein
MSEDVQGRDPSGPPLAIKFEDYTVLTNLGVNLGVSTWFDQKLLHLLFL